MLRVRHTINHLLITNTVCLSGFPKLLRYLFVVVWPGIFSKKDWKDQGRGFILLPPWPLNCLGQMLTVKDFSQHLVSSSKTIRPNIPRGAQCMGHCEVMWFVHWHHTHNSLEERDPICTWTNRNVQHQNANG